MAALGFGAAAAPAAGTMLAKSAMDSGQMVRGGSFGGYATKEISWSIGDSSETEPWTEPWTARGVSKMLWDAMHQEAREAREAVQNYYDGGIQGQDPVVFVCRSWSPAFGNSYTRNKLRELRRRAEELDAKLWPGPQ